MEPWQVDSMLLALHNIAKAVGTVASTAMLALFMWMIWGKPREKDNDE